MEPPAFLIRFATAYRELHDWLVWLGRDRSATSGRVEVTNAPPRKGETHG